MAAVSAVTAVAVDVTEETADAGPAVREGASLSMAMAAAVGDIVMSLAAAAVRGPGWVVGVWKCKNLRCHDIALTATCPLFQRARRPPAQAGSACATLL